jgi:alpha-galactosidase
MKNESTTRRRFLQLAAAGGAAMGARTVRAAARVASDDAHPQSGAAAQLGDDSIRIEFDRMMGLRVERPGVHASNPWSAGDYLLLSDGRKIDRFSLHTQSLSDIEGVHGKGRQLTVAGVSADGIEKTVAVILFDGHPGFAFYKASYRNQTPKNLKLSGWVLADMQIAVAQSDHHATPFWSYCGSTHEDRRDWVQPVHVGFQQDNYLGMSASDYGGGTPIVDVWRRDVGFAVGHIEMVPKQLSLPVSCNEAGVRMAVADAKASVLAPGGSLETVQGFITAHSGDYFATLDRYRRVMAELGVSFTTPPPAAYESIWCAWGYERECSVELIEKTLPKVQELGLRWAVVDDGWQSNVGDWRLNSQKFPRGSADMKQLVQSIDAHALKARLWFAPLAAAPGSDLLHDHSELLLLDKDGAPQLVSWWNSFYLCPAHPQTVAYTTELVRRFLSEWGFAGLKIDGQHLNGVAPCFNPAHHHSYPEESVEKLPAFMKSIYQAAIDVNPNAVIEVCPCGTSYSPFNFPAMNQAPASDPENSWQVRHKGKTLKGLMGPRAAFAGDHVELSDGGADFASTVGIGAIVSTKFTWPIDPKPKDSFLLTPEREALWRKWIALYNQNMLPLGVYRGELYDIGFDSPEGHVIQKDDRLYYAFYGTDFHGTVPLKGLMAPRYRVRDYFNDRALGEVSPSRNQIDLAFEHFVVLEAIPA